MSYTVQGESISNSARPPAYYEVEDSEVTVKNRHVRSDKPEEYYHLSPGKTTKGPDDTIPLREKVVDCHNYTRYLKLSVELQFMGN